jgi:hypothetical protein
MTMFTGDYMKYKVTKHYLKTKEGLIAAFSDLNDARVFIAKKITHDEMNRTKTIYRIYDDNELVQEFNNEVQAFSDPEDAETYSNAQFIFNVRVQLQNSLERITIAYFNDKEDADLFVTGKCSGDKSDSRDTFLIFKEHVLIATLNKNIIDNKVLKDVASSGNGTGATLSPLSKRPTPPGGPGDYWVEKKEDDE